ncbi:MAG: hypothetical protein KAI66_05895 [Lentisphaeria bacterium]|nr:hypothetical protein [Lentisphaeria bacterium]
MSVFSRFLCAFVLTVVSACFAAEPGEPIYPVGTRFPLLLYSIHTLEEMDEVADAGWNVGHRYRFSSDFFDTVEKAGWLCVAHLEGKTKVKKAAATPAKKAGKQTAAANLEEADGTGKAVAPTERLRTEEELAGDIRSYAKHDALAWWDLPEEQRWWYPDEYQIVKNLSAWTRKYDPKQRPNYMYIPGHYTTKGIGKYVQYLDIIGAGTYTEYSHQPRAWVRWRTEETVRAIKDAGFRIGRDYLHGEKIPIGIPMLFSSGLQKMDPTTPVGAYHDFWSCIASGARGIFVFSFWHRRDMPIFQKTWADGYNRAAQNLQRVPGLDQALLFGEDVPLTVTVTKGAPRTPTFRPFGFEEDISLPSVNVLGRKHEGTLYIVAVSSQERPVTATISGLPDGVTTLRVHCEDRKDGDEITPGKGGFEDTFPWLTVHLYTARLP